MDKISSGDRDQRLINAIDEVVQKKAKEVQSFQDVGIDGLAQQTSDTLDVMLKLKLDLQNDKKKKPFVSKN